MKPFVDNKLKPDVDLIDGYFPTSYITLSYKGDLELINKYKSLLNDLNKIRGS